MRRSSLEMDVAILQILSASKPMKLTHIMYQANVNAKVLKAKLGSLESKGLVKTVSLQKEHLNRQVTGRKFYGLTTEGLGVLHGYLSLYRLLESVKK
jgi:predicted transcriptional regulator